MYVNFYLIISYHLFLYDQTIHLSTILLEYVNETPVEFHNIDVTKVEENIYEPAPGEISFGRTQTSNENYQCVKETVIKNTNPFFKSHPVE